ncbi:MAG: hypothetical protein PHY05_00495 [Methanothrix sp.]|nr:hypothetical protein [Methanothrix sp.]
MADDEECPVATIYLFLHQAKSGCCEICLRLDGWYTAEEEPEPPYEILQHDFCRCRWVMFTITGLWRQTREELMNNHADLKQQFYDAVVEIAAWDDKIAERELQLGEEKEAKAGKEAEAARLQEDANDYMNQADQILYNSEEITDELQEIIDALLQQAEDALAEAEECLAKADEIQQDIYASANYISNANDQRDAEIYLRDEAVQKLNEVEPCLSMGCIEDKAAEIAGSRLIMEF